MSKNYTQLSLVQRYQIEAFWKAGMKQKLIAVELGVHPSTVCRELKRNIPSRGRGSGEYRAERAQVKTESRHREKPKRVVFGQEAKSWAARQLEEQKWSPEIISHKGRESGYCPVSHEWIYQWIWACKRSHHRKDRAYREMYRHLRHGRRRQKRGNRRDNRGVIPERVFIEKRPRLVEKRDRPGDVEVDLMMGRHHKEALLVTVDRSTLYTKLSKLGRKQSRRVAESIIRRYKDNPYPLHTFTFDNDKAFAGHRKVSRTLGVDTYFTRPYCSQDKGTVENRIGQIRRFLPKKTDLRTISSQEIRRIEKLLNERPVRKFNYKTPNQVLQEKIALIT
jgi:IS30 family transposase